MICLVNAQKGKIEKSELSKPLIINRLLLNFNPLFLESQLTAFGQNLGLCRLVRHRAQW